MRIDGSISFDDGLFTLHTATGIAMFHSHDPAISSVLKVLKHVGIVDFTRSRLLAAGIVAALEIGDFLPAAVDVGDQIPFGDLLVVEIKKNLA